MTAVKYCLSLMALVWLCGCSLEHPYPYKELYVLRSADLERDERAEPLVIEVGRARIAPPFDSRAFQYRVGEARYEPTYYAQWASDPGALVEESVSRMMRSTGAFVVVREASGVGAPLLQLDVTELYADVREPGATLAVVAIRATLLGHDGKALMVREIRREIRSGSEQPSDIVAAWSEGLGDALGALMPDLLVALDGAE